MLYLRSRTYNRQRPFISRFLKRSQTDSDGDGGDSSPANLSDNNPVRTERGTESTESKVRYRQERTVLNDGTVIRTRREVSTSEDEDAEATSQPEQGSDPEAEAAMSAEEEPEPEPEPEPEDPLDTEERELNHQLM